jgi:hypothetical protein
MEVIMNRFIFASVASISAVLACSAADPTSTSDEGLKQCPKSACGPQLGVPNYICPDGKTVAGPTGECTSTKKDPVCHWQVISCPPGPPTQVCTDADCGPMPMLYPQCADGGSSGPVCQPVDGVCQWQFTPCDGSCTQEECGPQPLYAVLCPDGGTGTATCDRVNGVCGWQPPTCN